MLTARQGRIFLPQRGDFDKLGFYGTGVQSIRYELGIVFGVRIDSESRAAWARREGITYGQL
jgi:hypothetical protein